MSRRSALGAGLLLGVLGIGACDQELPTDVGGEHLPESALRTYELILDDLAFIASDTLVRGFGTSNLSVLLIVAEDWLDTLDAHSLVRFADFPESVTYLDSTGTHTDTIARFIGGRIAVRLDTVALGLDTLGTDTTITFELYSVAEAFDSRTATWRARSVTAGDTAFWTTPGGTPGALLGSGSWVRSDTVARDSVVFQLDSATVAAWAVADDDARAVMITTTTAGARAQVTIPRLSLTARLEGQLDTTRATSAVVAAQTYLYDPPPPDPVDELRLGDRSAWRAFLTFREGLDTLTIACPNQPGCTFRLGDVTVNRAELWLSPLPVSEVHRPRGNFALEARPVLGGATLPLERAPLGDTTGVAPRVTPAHFEGVTDSVVTIPVTRFLRGLLAAGADTAVTDRDRTLALVTAPEPLAYGIARFGGVGIASAPVLRVIVTVPPREEDE